MKQTEIPTTKSELKKLIHESLTLRYTSGSKDGIETGNHYQSVTLGDERTAGFRLDRAAFLDRVDFRGKRVLDLGSNLGEMSRAARARGAALVDGFEYDPFFVELAQLVNAYNGSTRVSFYECDITDPTVYREHYDIVLALSVYVYLQAVLEPIAKITDGVLVVETHRLERNLESTYLHPIGRLLPHHVFLGASDWGSGLSEAGERAVIVFAKSEDALRSHLLGIPKTSQPLAAIRIRGTKPDIREVDVRRTPWYDPFFEAFAFKSPEELVAAIDGMEVNLDALAEEHDLRANGMSGWVYWLIFVKGALQFEGSGELSTGNAYYDLLARHWRNDPGRVIDYGDPQRLRALVQRRFQDFRLFRTHPGAPLQVEPLRLLIPEGPPTPSAIPTVKRIYQVGHEVPVETTSVDGYHRLFLARLFGYGQVPCDFIAERDAVPDPHG
jgi:SAM-dependent methyltransferase